MSEKVTFQELIESIAEETDKSKQFTHDFLKDFADVINKGLQKDRNVNIAGLGKFKLRRVDEREGYNPQTEEKMTIPAHNKIVFKPYKDLRELVNAPYAHLEPKLIKDEDVKEEKPEEAPPPTEETAQEDDFIPTAPPTSSESEIEETGESEEEQLTDPFSFDEDEVDFSPNFTFDDEAEETEDDESDIVEFKEDASATSEQEEPGEGEEEFTDTSEKPEERITESTDTGEDIFPEDDKTETESDLETDSVFEEESPDIKEETDKESEPVPSTPAPTINRKQKERRKNSSTPIVIAAAFIILLVAGTTWYMGFFSGNGTSDMATNQTPSVTETEPPANNQQDDPQPPANNNPSQQQAQSAQTQSQQSAGASQATAQEEDELAIEEGQTLWSIAEEKYGNPRLWPWIYGNNGSLENPDLIIAGNTLSVPMPSGPQNSLTSSDSTGVAKGFLATYRWYKDNQSPNAKNHLWAAKVFHDNIRDIAEVEIDKADLQFANKARQR